MKEYSLKRIDPLDGRTHFLVVFKHPGQGVWQLESHVRYATEAEALAAIETLKGPQ